ncbi:MAG TPA: hypothetical protein VNZ55_10245 [Thermomicrobiales bacterium]|nr:hypothetical protein [Thermomicrobiales bacterium]
MTLSEPTAVAFAVAGGLPTDAREWVTVDLAGQPSAHRRGYAILTESLIPGGQGEEIARQARTLILDELRRGQKIAPEAALMRAFATANTFIFEEGRFRGGVGQQFLVGATAIVFEASQATVAHVPPGQFGLSQDGVFYALPELGSWLPHYAEESDDAPAAEPLGFASWTSPIIVQTELRPGDTLILANAATGRAVARASADPGVGRFAPERFHGRDPDKVLDAIREEMLKSDDPLAAVTVIGFPPPERGSGIETIGDIGQNIREQWRHTRAAVRSVLPHRQAAVLPPTPVPASGPAPDVPPVGDRAPDRRWRQREQRLQDRLIELAERRSVSWRDTWRQPDDLQQLGAPTVHGIQRFRENWMDSEEASWKRAMPRLPFLRSRIFLGACLLLLVGILAVGYMERDRFLPSEEDYMGYIAEVDRRLILVQDMSSDGAVGDELSRASRELEQARSAGAPADLVRPRENQIRLEQDKVENVIRLEGVTRVGSLPEELQDAQTQAIHTPGGIFLANGSLYRLRPESREMVIVLQTGTKVEGMTVGDLFGVAYDGETLLTTDGEHVFFAGSADGAAWQAMKLEEINEQGPWPAGPVSAFSQNMYILEADYRNIYQFVLDPAKDTTTPIDWVLMGDRIPFKNAVDLTIDGNIYVLIGDGRVLTMYQGAQKATFDIPTFDDENETPLAIVGGSMTGYLYVAVVDDNGHGRVIAMDREGGHMSQLALPEGLSTDGANVLPPFDELQDIAVDEASGTLYLINGDAVWTARYSLPSLPEPEGTPEATPAVAE